METAAGLEEGPFGQSLRSDPDTGRVESAAQSNLNLSLRDPRPGRELTLSWGCCSPTLHPLPDPTWPIVFVVVALNPPPRNAREKTFHFIPFILSAFSLPPPSPTGP